MVSHAELQDCFDLLAIRRPEDPCHYAFCLPNSRAYARWPNFPAAARPEQGRAAAGRGIDAAQCDRSALGEALELASVCYWGDAVLVASSARALGGTAITPAELNGLSFRQIKDRDAWNRSDLGAVDWRPAPCPPELDIDWVTAADTDGAPCQIPADYVFVGRRAAGDADAVCLATTSGCAAGASPEAAKCTALLECVERDAIGRWWYGQTPKPCMQLENLPLPDPLRHYLETRPRRILILDLTTETGIPVIAAASSTMDGTGVALGFGCATSPDRAGLSAVVEMLQTELGLEQRIQQDDPLCGLWIREMHIDQLPVTDRALAAPPSPPQNLTDLVARLTGRGHRVAFVDFTRPEFGVPVFRAVVPGLWSDKPRFSGFERAGQAEPTGLLPLLV